MTKLPKNILVATQGGDQSFATRAKAILDEFIDPLVTKNAFADAQANLCAVAGIIELENHEGEAKKSIVLFAAWLKKFENEYALNKENQTEVNAAHLLESLFESVPVADLLHTFFTAYSYAAHVDYLAVWPCEDTFFMVFNLLTDALKAKMTLVEICLIKKPWQ